jgi:hypothetical protein
VNAVGCVSHCGSGLPQSTCIVACNLCAPCAGEQAAVLSAVSAIVTCLGAPQGCQVRLYTALSPSLLHIFLVYTVDHISIHA